MLFLALAVATACAQSEGTQAVRDRMVDLIERRGVSDARVLAAMRRFPRHELVPERLRDQAYADWPLPIGLGQTISQPYIVALMSELARVKPGDKVLEVGTGSGYQAAILALAGARVFSIEILPELCERARADLARLGVGGVELRAGDGFAGWPEEAPFAAIVVTAAPRQVPAPLLAQLAEGGRLVIPVGDRSEQVLEVHTRRGDRIEVTRTLGVRFVPMTGQAEQRP